MSKREEAAQPLRLTPPSRKTLTAEQQRLREEQSALTRRMSERGIPAPAGNVFGGKPSTKR